MFSEFDSQRGLFFALRPRDKGVCLPVSSPNIDLLNANIEKDYFHQTTFTIIAYIIDYLLK
jgi:hypothetical protein